jgi:3-phosphoshikimate 1-carboxyvinyltransferase
MRETGPVATEDEPWDAPFAEGRPVDAVVRIPGSKSVTNRAVLLAAVADGPTVVRRPLVARDTRLMLDAVQALGAEVAETEGPDDGADGAPAASWQITPRPLRGPASVDCGLAGTVMRFVPPVAALATGSVRFDGDPRARERPTAPLLHALRALGATVADDGRGTLPFTVWGTGGLAGGEVTVDAAASSQFVSGLLLAGSRFDKGLLVHARDATVPSLPHVDMTVSMLAARGVPVEQPAPGSWRIEPAVPRGGQVVVEPDVSNAFPFAAAALATGGQVRIPGFPVASPYQPDTEVRELLERLGAQVHDQDGQLVVDGAGGIHGVADLDLHRLGELVPVVAVLAALADSDTRITGVAHLRGHETDRLHALEVELGRLGCDVRQTPDGLVINPRPMTGTTLQTHHDHRLATAWAVVGLAVPGVRVIDVGTTAKTMPDFVRTWTGMLTA